MSLTLNDLFGDWFDPQDERWNRTTGKHYGIEKYCQEITPVGSRITCNPAPTDTDEDYLVLCYPKHFDAVLGVLYRSGFEMGGSCPTPTEEAENTVAYGFSSFRKDEVNYIITTDEEFYCNFMKATAIAKKLNLLDKQQRIDLFQAILYDNY